MKIERIPVGTIQANCYILGCNFTKEGIIIDPGADAQGLISKIKELDLKIKYILLTHGHYDHIAAVNEIKRKIKAPICIHSLDKEILENPELNLSTMFGQSMSVSYDIELKEGDVLSIGNIKLKIIHTPGHTPGGICIVGDQEVFTGDTLFAGSIGRTDFPQGNMKKLLSSIKNKLFVLPGDTKIYPGHGPSSTIEQEKNTNPFFR